MAMLGNLAQIDYNQGVSFSIIISLVLTPIWLFFNKSSPSLFNIGGIITQFTNLSKITKNKSRFSKIGNYSFLSILIALVLLCIYLLVSFYLFLIFFPIVNFVFLLDDFSAVKDGFKGELENGVLMLRISSLMVGVEIFIMDYKKSNFDFIDFDEIQENLNKNKNFYSDSNYIPLASSNNFRTTVLGQYFFYAGAIIILWISTINNFNSMLGTIINWLIFFIIDDWTVIVEYVEKNKLLILKKHLLKIIIFNLLILAFATCIIYMYFGFFVSLFVFIVTLIASLFVYTTPLYVLQGVQVVKSK